MNLEQFIKKLTVSPKDLQFEETMAVIDLMYDYLETDFINGNIKNKAGENAGSCRLLSFAQLNHLSKEDTLNCFGQYYRDVIASPYDDSHQNIRQFMLHGWLGVQFSQQSLTLK